MTLEELKSIETDDLMELTPLQVFVEVTLSLPWLILELVLLHCGQIILATGAAFYFFLTGLRQVHGGYHLTLGLSKTATDRFLFFMSVAMLGSMHAVKFNHLMHHRHNLSSEDIEARSAHMRWWGAILFGPVFPILMHIHALRRGGEAFRGWIMKEMSGNIAVVTLAVLLAALQATPVPLLHVTLMATGQCLTAFFAVWTVHHDCEAGGVFARTQNGAFKNIISYSMFLHVEHHLFPGVPHRNLPVVSARLQMAAPDLRTRTVF